MKEYRIARWIYPRIPTSIKHWWEHRLEAQFKHRKIDPGENRRAQLEFELRQITLLFYGILAVSLLTVLIFLGTRARKEMTYERNPFGKGEKEIHFQMSHEGEKEEVTLSLEEKTLSGKEEKEIYQTFLKDLETVICGDNRSLQEVNQPLNLVEELEGYPFSINYQPEDLSLLKLNGQLGETARALTGREKRQTRLSIEISYKEYQHNYSIPVRMIASEKRSLSFFENVREKLLLSESNSREKEHFVVDESAQGIRVRDSSSQGKWFFPILVAVVTFLLLVKGHTDLKEEEKIRHQQNMEDFPLIVHLLTLYMGAGLSFPSAVHRISQDYCRRQRKENPRYAFEQMMIMDHCMEMGIRPKEACDQWAKQFREKAYGKFAMLLSQSFSKGSKDIRSMMEREQQDAFQVQVDYVRRAGEEASTRLLFPMIILLGIIMVLVIFPAALQFYSI